MRSIRSRSDTNSEIAALKRLGRSTEGRKLRRSLPNTRRPLTEYLRTGGERTKVNVEEKARIAFEKKAMAVQSEPDGGYAVIPQVETQIDQTIRDISPVRAAATVVQIGTDRLRRPFNVHGTNSGWAAETGGRPEDQLHAASDE